MYALVEILGKQYKAEVGKEIQVDLVKAEIGAQVTYESVLALVDEKTAKFGAPYVKGASVVATLKSNFKDDKDVGHGELTSGHKYDLNQHMQLSYNNFAFDLPLTVKFGGHIEHTTFIYMSLTFGITKSLYEDMTSRYTLDIKDPSKELEEEIAILEKEGKATYPLTETHEIEKPFYMDDWETNGWVGVGIDGKYVSIGADFLVAAGSTKDNHRYYHMFQKDFPSFRVMIDFSLR